MLNRRSLLAAAALAGIGPARAQALQSRWFPGGWWGRPPCAVVGVEERRTGMRRAVFDFLLQADHDALRQTMVDAGCVLIKVGSPCSNRHISPGVGIPCFIQATAMGENPVRAFTTGCTRVLDHLVAERVCSRDGVAALGGSIGGFMGLHLAAADARIGAVAALAPVTSLAYLQEAQASNLGNDPRLLALDLDRQAASLGRRQIWLSIGASDERVGTNRTLDLAQAIKAANPDAKLRITVTEDVGHKIGSKQMESAIAWLLAQAGPPSP